MRGLVVTKNIREATSPGSHTCPKERLVGKERFRFISYGWTAVILLIAKLQNFTIFACSNFPFIELGDK